MEMVDLGQQWWFSATEAGSNHCSVHVVKTTNI
jgi:hypothetical protein